MSSTSHVPQDINVIHSFIVVITFCNSQFIYCAYHMYSIVLRVIPGILIMLFITLNALLGDTEYPPSYISPFSVILIQTNEYA